MKQRWKLTYVINSGDGMFGLEPARPHSHEVEIDAAGLDDDQILEALHTEIHKHTDGLGVLTGAEEIEVTQPEG
ncbi:hypothetical protein [Streptomyces hygroscopicus]|uniref:hypothetical protein n=1 Tax=Streptomyces hygroscopicus TaxID=1912 RepID=UPI0007677373|nr:hypothetical protein [Streptomyces hygroscopicus]